jgi:hypothetical protein
LSLTCGGTVASGSTFTVTNANGKTVVFTATTTSASDAAAGVLALLQASPEPEFQESTYSVLGAVITVTGPANGANISFATAAGGSGSPTFVTATVTSGTGPNYWSNTANWSTGSLPASTDNVIADGPNLPPILYALDAHTILPTTFTVGNNVDSAFSIGLPPQNTKGYAEWRGQYLQLGATTFNVGGAPTRIKLAAGSTATTFNINATGTAQSGEQIVTLTGSSITSLNVNNGAVGVAYQPGETSTVTTLRIAAGANATSSVVAGVGLTLTTLDWSGGTVALAAAVTTILGYGGVLTITGSGAVTTATIYGGSLSYQSTGTITTLNVGGNGLASFREDLRSRTVTNCTLYEGGQLFDPYHTCTFTNGVILPDADITGVTLAIGTGRTVTIT